MEYVQVPIDEESDNSSSDAGGASEASPPQASTTSPQGDRSIRGGGFLRKTVSESSLSEDNDESIEGTPTDDENDGAPDLPKEEENEVSGARKDKSSEGASDQTEDCTPRDLQVFAVGSSERPPPAEGALKTSDSRHGGLKLHRQEALASTGSRTSLDAGGSVDTGTSLPHTLQSGHPSEFLEFLTVFGIVVRSKLNMMAFTF